MMCAVTVREIKPDSYDEFRKAWEPDPWYPRLDRALVLRNEDNPDQVLTIGFFSATQDELDTEVRDSPEILAAEERRLRRIAQFEERVVLNGIFEVADEVTAPAQR